MANKKTYPKSKDEWSIDIHKGLGITPMVGKQLFKDGNFPIQDLCEWIENEYSDGFGPDFVPALLRNIKGLITWVYGGGPEPYWPGSDVK